MKSSACKSGQAYSTKPDVRRRCASAPSLELREEYVTQDDP